MQYKRTIEKQIKKYLSKKDYKILFIWGPRRSGKTTLLNKISKQANAQSASGGQTKNPIFNFDLQSDQDKFTPDYQTLEKIALNHSIILIDEVQNHPESTLPLKILHDQFKVKIIATGSSELKQKTKKFDSLSGRFKELFCLPLSLGEIKQNTKIKTYHEKEFYQQIQEKIQIFGNYPEIWKAKKEDEKINLLQNIFDTYILKDIINIYKLKNTKLAKDILTKIALQLGSEVSLREIANSLQANVSTVTSYIEIFIKNYVLFPLPSFKTNLRRAVSENRKFYFYDLGIRNILVKDFRSLDLRPDKGGVFENFIISEIFKNKKNNNYKLNLYFYREYGGKEIDLVLENYKKNYICVEIKSKKDKSQKIFPIPHQIKIINSQNYFKIIPQLPASFLAS